MKTAVKMIASPTSTRPSHFPNLPETAQNLSSRFGAWVESVSRI